MSKDKAGIRTVECTRVGLKVAASCDGHTLQPYHEYQKTHVHACTHKRNHTRTHTHTHIHIHTHTQICMHMSAEQAERFLRPPDLL